jgi:hypothetical protein
VKGDLSGLPVDLEFDGYGLPKRYRIGRHPWPYLFPWGPFLDEWMIFEFTGGRAPYPFGLWIGIRINIPSGSEEGEAPHHTDDFPGFIPAGKKAGGCIFD